MERDHDTIAESGLEATEVHEHHVLQDVKVRSQGTGFTHEQQTCEQTAIV